MKSRVAPALKGRFTYPVHTKGHTMQSIRPYLLAAITGLALAHAYVFALFAIVG